MAERMLRRGLPRVKGGEPWPPTVAVEVPEASVEGTPSAPAVAAAPVEPAVVERPDETSRAEGRSASTAASASTGSASEVPAAASGVALRRGLPRVKGGEPWPPAASATPSAPAPAESAIPARTDAVSPAAAPAVEDAPASAPAPTTAPAAASATATAPTAADGITVRRGLPRINGGEPWPPAGTAPAIAAVTPSAGPPAVGPIPASGPTSDVSAPEAHAPAVVVQAAAPAALVPVGPDVSTPLPFRRTVWQGTAPRHGAPEPERSRFRPTWTQGIAGLLAAAGLGILGLALIGLVRWFLSVDFMQDFLAAFPGEYEPAVHVEPGFAPWVGWQHFFNMFLMVLIIRSGLRVRSEKRPTVFWTSRRDAKSKISLTLWFHQALDLLWLINGVIFVILLFTTGHWARIVPTSWEVIPNAISAGLQYVSFDWPAENGWNNYNSLQQLAYFVTVFIAAPLATVTGVRMSGLWPKNAEKLSKAYPVEWARALHFPVMLYFVAFIIAHVALVFLTGMLGNLNHMFASQQSDSWLGFWVFVAAIAVIAAGWFAARPLVLAPIAKLFGQVSGR